MINSFFKTILVCYIKNKLGLESNAQKAENKPWYMKLLERVSLEISHTVGEAQVKDSRIAELEKRLDDLKTLPSTPAAEKGT